MRHRILTLAVLPAVVALTACGGGYNNNSGSTQSTGSSNGGAYGGSGAPVSGSGASSTGAAVTISEKEFQLTPSDATAKAGKVTIVVKNTGTIPHALSLEGAGPGGKDLETAPIQPGQSAKLTATLKAGKIEMYCPIDGHKSKGMKGELTVQ